MIFIILFACSLLAQQGKQYVFSRYNTGNGLASNYVNNLVQDQQGFIWLATINGLHKYDGHKFTTFKHETNNPATVPSDNIAEVYGDARNNLWVSTADNKVGIFNTHTFIYKEISIKSDAISTIYTVKRFSKPGPGS
ncbi:MAG: two-component regulator propeller domain-containing protein [Chitinophagaceae bacterium]